MDPGAASDRRCSPPAGSRSGQPASRLFRRMEFSSETSAATVLARRTETSMWVALPAFQESIDC
jgi:hypothetical protein